MDYFDLLLWLATHPIESFFIVLVQFIAVMWVKERTSNPLLTAILALWFLPQDIVVNVSLFSIVGLEVPQEWTATARFKRWKKIKQTKQTSKLNRWRFRVGTNMCRILNKFDLGHC